MPKTEKRVEVNGFIKGLVSEASPLNFPDSASLDESNFDLRKDGTRNRRLGLNGETGYQIRASSAPSDNAYQGTYHSFVWEAVGGDPDKNYLVINVRGRLSIFDYEKQSISGNAPLAVIVLTGIPLSFTSIEGYLVTAVNNSVVIIDGSFNVTYTKLKVRDVWGVQETDPNYESDPTWRGSTFDYGHLYNLRNQSWGIPRRNYNDPHNLIDPAKLMVTEQNSMPSNSEVVWTGVLTRPVDETWGPKGTTEEIFWPRYMNDTLGSQLKAPKGFFILDDVLQRGASRNAAYSRNNVKHPELDQGAVTFKSDQSASGPNVVASMSGHVFFAGFDGTLIDGDIRSPNLSNYVFFSQLVKSAKEINLCYQDGDPTSRESADLVETDGGFVKISGARNILSLHPLGLSLIVIADNGVWAITGQDINSGFSATNYKVSKVSTFGGVGNGQSTVVVGTNLFYLSNEGIFVIQPNDIGNPANNSLTDGTIQKTYNKISPTAKSTAYAVYDPVNKKIRWLFNLNIDSAGNGFWSNQQYVEYCFDLNLQAFTRNDIGAFSNYAIVAPFSASLHVNQVINRVEETSFIRYILLIYNPTSLSFTVLDFNDTQWRDLKLVDGVGIDAKAHCLTGYQIAGDSVVDKQAPYLVMHFKRTEQTTDSDAVPVEQSSCMFRMQWNFSSSEISNKWTPLREAYRYVKPMLAFPNSNYDTGFDIISTRNKVRGNGKSFALYFETSPYKACNVVGWNLTLTANSLS
ncbi:hypothetical protein [Burkholderia territorii]|uniref:hypothetical protein n=1 Tax=Burkholderia territorii TaxID=1503055 RepID=UPI000AC767F8|nr:hypothetical protein [Burkholderia territorii]